MAPNHRLSHVPPRCPYRDCIHHEQPAGWRHVRTGTYTRKVQPSVVQRYRCLACQRGFSAQTFETTYYLKRPDLQLPILHALVSCSGIRQAARALAVAPSTVQRQASRLGRHCLLVLHEDGLQVPQEDLVLDGLVTFEWSQYWPCEINFLVGARSHYVQGFTFSQLRRSGRMTAAQKARRAELEARHGRPDPKATEKAVRDLFLHSVPPGIKVTVRSDEHAAYVRALEDVPQEIEHRRTSSKVRRDRRNPLFAVNLLDALVRHSNANHKRETLAFAKRLAGALERLAVLVLWRNLVKRTSERDSKSLTPAQRIGRCRRRLSFEDVLARRRFPSLVTMPKPMWEVYWRRVKTAQLPTGTRHALVRAA